MTFTLETIKTIVLIVLMVMFYIWNSHSIDQRIKSIKRLELDVEKKEREYTDLAKRVQSEGNIYKLKKDYPLFMDTVGFSPISLKLSDTLQSK